MSDTKIEWADKVWNPITGCSPCSPGCDHCYAHRMANRLKGRYGYPKDKPFRVTFHPNRLIEPLRWRKPSRIFTVSMGDVFNEAVPFSWVEQVYSIIYRQNIHQFLVLTKRPRRMFEFHSRSAYMVNAPFLNLWLGVTVCNQEEADQKIPFLRSIPATCRFVSVEPMLSQIDLCLSPGMEISADYANRGIHLVICGGETGPGARPLHPDWVRSLRDQCQSANVPFFFKQWGGHKSSGHLLSESGHTHEIIKELVKKSGVDLVPGGKMRLQI